MIKAFVFGKFLPFHNGHKAMIDFALTRCDFLTVLVCCSEKESFPGKIRTAWVEKTFHAESRIEVRALNYLESELPNTSETSIEVSEIWATAFKKMLPDHSLVITSEAYGDFVAGFMNIRHIEYDISKTLFPVSANAIRNDLFAYWNFLPGSVKQDLAIKVIIAGTESTGKTTMTKKLANHFNCSFVLEAGRDIIADSNFFAFEDLHVVAQVHANRIQAAAQSSSPLIIIDTDIHTTKSYSKFAFGKELQVSERIYDLNKAHLYIYLESNAEYVQDGTRLSEEDRNLLDKSHRHVLAAHNISIIQIVGNWKEKFAKAAKAIEELIKRPI